MLYPLASCSTAQSEEWIHPNWNGAGGFLSHRGISLVIIHFEHWDCPVSKNQASKLWYPQFFGHPPKKDHSWGFSCNKNPLNIPLWTIMYHIYHTFAINIPQMLAYICIYTIHGSVMEKSPQKIQSEPWRFTLSSAPASDPWDPQGIPTMTWEPPRESLVMNWKTAWWWMLAMNFEFFGSFSHSYWVGNHHHPNEV